MSEEERTARGQAQRLKLDFVNLRDFKIPQSLLSEIPRSVASAHNILPLFVEHGKLLVIVGNAEEPGILERLEVVLNRKIQLCVAQASEIENAIPRDYDNS